MKVRDLAQNVEICRLSDNLQKTAQILQASGLDAIPLVDEQSNIVGVATQARVCQALAEFDRKPSTIKNSAIKLDEPLICKPQEKFAKILKKLAKKERKYAVFSSQNPNAVAIISLPTLLLRFTEGKKVTKKVFRAMEEINRPRPLVLSEIGIENADE